MADPVTSLRFTRRDSQRAWLWVGVSFLLFYFGEVVLFWHGGPLWGAPLMKIPFGYPVIYPLGFWGLFGWSVFAIQKRKADKNAGALTKRYQRWQGIILSVAITTGVIGVAFVVIVTSGNITLGHTALFFSLFLAGAVIGGTEMNAGWLSASVLWLCTALFIKNYPAGLNIFHGFKDEDIWIGLATTLGFWLIGALPYYVKRPVEGT